MRDSRDGRDGAVLIVRASSVLHSPHESGGRNSKIRHFTIRRAEGLASVKSESLDRISDGLRLAIADEIRSSRRRLEPTEILREV